MKRIALATGTKLPTLNEDDLLLVPPLRELGVTAVSAVWDSPDVCWEEFQGVVVRSCWDYHHRLEEPQGLPARSGGTRRPHRADTLARAGRAGRPSDAARGHRMAGCRDEASGLRERIRDVAHVD